MFLSLHKTPAAPVLFGGNCLLYFLYNKNNLTSVLQSAAQETKVCHSNFRGTTLIGSGHHRDPLIRPCSGVRHQAAWSAAFSATGCSLEDVHILIYSLQRKWYEIFRKLLHSIKEGTGFCQPAFSFFEFSERRDACFSVKYPWKHEFRAGVLNLWHRICLNKHKKMRSFV